jgi:hypothetical protein
MGSGVLFDVLSQKGRIGFTASKESWASLLQIGLAFSTQDTSGNERRAFGWQAQWYRGMR